MAIHARKVAATTLVAACVALGSLTAGAGSAAAEPGPGQCGPQGCVEQNGPGGHGRGEQNGHGWQAPPEGYRGIDQGRRDHQPFDYQGQRVEPIFRPDFNQWGFWFLGLWIPL